MPEGNDHGFAVISGFDDTVLGDYVERTADSFAVPVGAPV